jgi:AcrR family transcriptional regulator
MPRLWTDTIDAHRHAVREATLDSAAALVAERGLRGVTMVQIAEAAGVGRATLYKYFPDVEAILAAWHQRQIQRHLQHLATVSADADGPAERLEAVLRAYAHVSSQFGAHHDERLFDFLHQDRKVTSAQRKLRRMIGRLIQEAGAIGAVRTDIGPDELADYCLNALAAARRAGSASAVDRLVSLTLDGLRPPG